MGDFSGHCVERRICCIQLEIFAAQQVLHNDEVEIDTSRAWLICPHVDIYYWSDESSPVSISFH